MELTPKQKALALSIANRLNDLDWLSLHEDMAQKYSEEFLMAKLNYVLGRSDIINKARYYTSLVTRSKPHGAKNNSRP